ncbi:NAD(P)H-hydrate dehydratase [Pseudoalteromonas sp. Cnat2-41]|uniref:NAD(P)H-hydrate dehydratase n=1 Tax=unclassified Pseudoalteromonas TaxID=194690 RepID=UPI001EF7A06F|nr:MULTISPECIES: NAD(P)H-hydrate dehydratase [unclassified Pseudoalteromonas]MCF2862654.1 NAD(P)H-hydrate dehydratase [Pseudoalteromonas sp. CNAT2-18]MCG7558894.1 NAD(P)H-hydrate dehydratase [Pseudoalteromonas sp. CNAT2-18.1]
MDSHYSTNLPQLVFTPQQLQQYEAAAAKHSGVSMQELMHRAGSTVAHWIQQHYDEKKRVIVLSGGGNNAGDGFVVATELRQQGYDVKVWPLVAVHTLKGDAATMYERFKQSGGECVQDASLHHYHIVVDAIFGIGLNRALPEPIADVLAKVNAAKVMRIAIDVPSGVDAHSAQVHNNAFNAHHTLTFIALKQGLLSGRAKTQCGHLWFAPLAIEQAFYRQCSAVACLNDHASMMRKRPVRDQGSHKNNAGHVLVVAGGLGMAGAARLASEAALRTGAGLVSVATHPDNVQTISQGCYELMVHGVTTAQQLTVLLEKANVVVIGPGLGQCQWAQQMLSTVLGYEHKRLKVLDADALNLLAQHPQRLTDCVLTPHPKEAARLLQSSVTEVEANRFAKVQELARSYQATVLLKGPGTLICSADKLTINSSGSNALASGGMGDVLSGIIGALLAQGVSPHDSACVGAYVHGLAAQQASSEGSKGLLASDLFPVVRALIG